MTTTELKERFNALYDYMSVSGNAKYMKTFGKVMQEMMDWFIINKPDMAMMIIDKLESIKWKNYLSRNEADEIIANMLPRPIWTREQWMSAMENIGLDTEEEPYYNSCALFVAMSMEYSDSSHTIAKLMGKTPDEVSNDDMLKATYLLALDKLKDKDKVFCIREYFGL
jgi:hypothetical protein